LSRTRYATINKVGQSISYIEKPVLVYNDVDLNVLEEASNFFTTSGANYLPDEMIDPSIIRLLYLKTGLIPKRYSQFYRHCQLVS